jgi:hypothetical protein
MDAIRRGLAVTLAILFSLTAVLALVFFNLDRRAFTAETYQRVFANEAFYDRLPAVLAGAVTSSPAGESNLPVVMQQLSPEAWEAFFRAMLPGESLKRMGDQVLESVFSYLNGKSSSAGLSLAPLKATMTSEAGVQAIYTLLNTQPDCTLVQVARMTVDLLTQGQIEFCKPPEDLHPLLTPAIQAQLQLTAAVLPDQVTLASAEGIPLAEDPRQQLRALRFLMRLTPLIPLAFLLLMTFLAVNSFESWLDWWGTPMLVTGLSAGIMGLSGAPVIGLILQRALVRNMPEYLPVILLDYAGELARAMVHQLLKPVMWQGFLLALMGTLMAVASFFVKRRRQTVPPSEEKTII